MPSYSRKRYEIRHDILDLFGRQDRLAAPRRPDAIEAVDAVIGRHDGRGIEAGRIHQPEPKLALGPAAAGTGKVRRQVALEFLFGKWAAVAEDASAGTFDDEGAPARHVAGRARERLRNGIADDGIAAKVFRGREAGQGEERAGKDRTRYAMRASSQRLPP